MEKLIFARRFELELALNSVKEKFANIIVNSAELGSKLVESFKVLLFKLLKHFAFIFTYEIIATSRIK